MTYYDRTVTVHVDGTPIFKTSEDEQHEQDVAALVGEAWNCSVRSFGRLAPIDFYAERHGRLIGLLELKARSHSTERFPTVFLNVRKWLSLALGSTGLGVPSVFIVRFDDGVMWVPIGDIDASRITMGGCVRTVKARSDVEPVIEVPISALRPLQSEAEAA